MIQRSKLEITVVIPSRYLKARRVSTLLEKSTTIHDHDSVVFTQPSTHQTLGMGDQRSGVPFSLSNELLHSPNGVQAWANQFQYHRFNGPALQIRQLAAKIKPRLLPLLAALK